MPVFLLRRPAAQCLGSTPSALRIGFRPASFAAGSVQPVPRETAPPFAPPVSPTGRVSGAAAPLR